MRHDNRDTVRLCRRSARLRQGFCGGRAQQQRHLRNRRQICGVFRGGYYDRGPWQREPVGARGSANRRYVHNTTQPQGPLVQGRAWFVLNRRMKYMMHLRTYWLKYRRWLVFFVIGVALFIAGTRTFGSATDIRGWFWNAYQPENSNDKIGLGWTSMSCLNDFDNDGLLEYECSNGALNTVYGVSISLGADAALNGTNDYVQGCAWSSAYGWVCFNGGAGQQCSAGNACTDLSASGVSIVAGKYCSNNPMTSCTSSADCDDNPCNAYFYHLQSPAYPSWPTGANEHATVLSLYDDADEVKGYVRFPFTDDASVVFDPELSPPAQDTLFGCFGCRNVCGNNASLACVSDDDCPGGGTCGVCDACLNTSTSPEADENPNPNLLCWKIG